MNTCATCKWWHQFNDVRGDGGLCQHIDVDSGGLGANLRIYAISGFTLKPDAIARTPILETAATFGCVLHESKK